VVKDLDAGITPLRKPSRAGPTEAGRPSRAKSLRRGAAVLALALGSLVGMGLGAQAASAHARCDGASHRDWHTAAFHNDRHYLWRTERVRVGRYTYKVIFRNDRHSSHRYTKLCR
jgi:hypothetical protein